MENTRCNGVIFYWMPVLCFAGFLFYVSSLSNPALPRFVLSDKILHILAYTAFGFLWVRAWKPLERGWGFGKTLLVAFLGCVLYGLTDEFHQSFVPRREVSVADILADGIGGILGGLFYQLCPAFMK